MNKHHSNSNIIERKLGQLPAADADLLWNDMHLILDRNMPQKKERRRFIGWFLSGKGLFLLTFASLFITSSVLFLLYSGKSTPVIGEETPAPHQTSNIIKNDAAKVLHANKENAITIINQDQLANEGLLLKGSSTSDVDYVTANSIPAKQTSQQHDQQSSINQIDQQSNTTHNTRENSKIDLADSKSLHQEIQIATRNSNEISIPQPLGNSVKANNGRNEKGFYAGIMMGADLSSVQFQSAKPGATMGFILGYAFDQKWSIESGLLWDTKRVYDDGKYFNPPGYTPTNGITITAVNGKSRLHEWPVNVKYSIKSKDHSFFATTGISSYFMKLENYDYEYTQNNQPGGHNYLSYKKETKDWFGVVNFSLGYSHKLGANGHIRIEPYLKLPITNIGTANMPVMSTGLNIGITKPLRR